jgi:hypothetical protein
MLVHIGHIMVAIVGMFAIRIIRDDAEVAVGNTKSFQFGYGRLGVRIIVEQSRDSP